MKPVYLVTGSSGFIGTHVCALGRQVLPSGASLAGLDRVDPNEPVGYRHLPIDICDRSALSARELRDPAAIIHLAARAEVVTPLEDLGSLSTTNVNGTANLLLHLNPRTFVFASSSAVYGNGTRKGVQPVFSRVKPVGTYGLSKVFGEMACADWCREKGGSAVAFRFGNVVGQGCRGFIPFLVRHALAHPDGDVLAECRGGGRILRDYVPVEYIVALLWRAATSPWKPGFRAFNAGTGHGMTNGEVAGFVAAVLGKQGYRLNISWKAALQPGESKSIVLDINRTARTFDIPVPSQDSVIASIEAATLFWVSRLRGFATAASTRPASFIP